eukprot:997958-Amphidinium_carterae.1
MQEFFTKQRMTAKQPGHRLWVNNKETRTTPPDLDQAQSDKIIDLTEKDEIDNPPGSGPIHIPPPPGLAMPMPDVDNAIPQPADAAPQPELPVQGGGTPEAVDNDVADNPSTAAYKPTHKLTGKQSPPHQVRAIVAQLDDIEKTKEIRLENNEDKEEKRQM